MSEQLGDVIDQKQVHGTHLLGMIQAAYLESPKHTRSLLTYYNHAKMIDNVELTTKLHIGDSSCPAVQSLIEYMKESYHADKSGNMIETAEFSIDGLLAQLEPTEGDTAPLDSSVLAYAEA